MSMDPEEKRLRLQTIELALEDINKIIDTMEKKSYPKDQLNEYYKKRWELWNEEFRTKKA